MRLKMWLRVVAVVVVGAAVCCQGSFEDDREALISLYLSLGGSDWTNNANWTDNISSANFDLSTWYGVSTTSTGVKTINLEQNNLVGSLPELQDGQLSELQFMYMRSNKISGTIPASLQNLTYLSLLDLGDNSLGGAIPPEIGNIPSLASLLLDDNDLSGDIPRELGKAEFLTHLNLNGNGLEGFIPSELGNASILRTLNLGGNGNLEGPIPAEIGNLTRLKTLNLNNNSLSGEIAPEFESLALNYGSGLSLDFSNNFLSGVVPAGLVAENLAFLDLSGNRLEGQERADGKTAAPFITPTVPPTPHPTVTPTPSPTPEPTESPTAISPPPPTPATETPSSSADDVTDIQPPFDDDDIRGGGSDGGGTGIAIGLTAAGLAFVACLACGLTWRKRVSKGTDTEGKRKIGVDKTMTVPLGWRSTDEEHHGREEEKRGEGEGEAEDSRLGMWAWLASGLRGFASGTGRGGGGGGGGGGVGVDRGGGGVEEGGHGGLGPSPPPAVFETNATERLSTEVVAHGASPDLISATAVVAVKEEEEAAPFDGGSGVGFNGGRGGGGGGGDGGGDDGLGDDDGYPYGIGAPGKRTSSVGTATTVAASQDSGERRMSEGSISVPSSIGGGASSGGRSIGGTSSSGSSNRGRNGTPGNNNGSKSSRSSGGSGSGSRYSGGGNSGSISGIGIGSVTGIGTGTGERASETAARNPHASVVETFTPLATAERHGLDPLTTTAATTTTTNQGMFNGHPQDSPGVRVDALRRVGTDDGDGDEDASAEFDGRGGGSGGGGGGGGGGRGTVGGDGTFLKRFMISRQVESGGVGREGDKVTGISEEMRRTSLRPIGDLGDGHGGGFGGVSGLTPTLTRATSLSQSSPGVIPSSSPPPSSRPAVSSRRPLPLDQSITRSRLERQDEGDGKLDKVLHGFRAAAKVAQSSSVLGVAEVGSLVEALVGVAEDHRGNASLFDRSRRLCESLVYVLKKGEGLLAAESSDGAGSMLLKCVQDDLRAMIEMMNYYQRQPYLPRVWKATMYKRRHQEAEESVVKMLAYLSTQLGVDMLEQVRILRNEVKDMKDITSRPTSESEARKRRREQLIAQEELPPESVDISDELIGSGGSGSVFMADFGGINAAAKVFVVDGDTEERTRQQRSNFLVELQHMRGLKSPHIVNAFGIITSIEKKLVLVMEFMPGGDLFRFVERHREGNRSIEEKVARRIIRNIAEGMAFLHRKKTWHGDLKSLNVLLDADNRAKISDFGTSHCTELSKSRSLQTMPGTNGTMGANLQLSYKWAAPEVMDQLNKASSHSAVSASGETFREICGGRFMSDVYSFGIVVWEVLSTQVPWDNCASKDMFRRVVMLEERPLLPVDALPDLASLVKRCWVSAPESRPSFDDIVSGLRPSPPGGGDGGREEEKGGEGGALPIA